MHAAWVTPHETVAGPGDLAREGIVCESFDASSLEHIAQRLGGARGFSQRSDVRRTSDNPKDEAALAKEADEHAHIADEVRLVLEGEAVYDILSHDNERWLRVWLRPGDAIVIPARRYHRVVAPQFAVLHYFEVFGEASGLIPLYRASESETRAG